ncbi:O-antigen polymerase [Halalkalibacter akibai]|uniref:Oligosaccharide repeat unit polymerase n=1 Tax=Halalkalibacter akibai (strain ATCC 43226 / DSM 21942 / CIP 109018 / JCM 9157 / 1139) TaxID=1236973 RepID=W4QTQ9_HALA3|nr:O-antigen polymerase [Halalkalibacter akibai]GAE34988.1 hypothetical protein JCM9157_2077 [Halalkalibacter akibai JCM 9157]
MILLVFLLSFFLILSLIIHKKIFILPNIFIGVWLLTILLYSLELSHNQPPLSNTTIVVLLITFSVFIGGYYYTFLYYVPTYKKRKSSLESKKKTEPVKKLFAELHLNENFLKISFYLSITLIGLEVVYSGGFPLIWNITGASKNYFDFGIPTFHGLLMSFILFLSSFLYLAYKKTKKRNYLFYLFVIFVVLILLYTRQNIIILCFQIMLLHHFIIKKINFAKLFPFIIIFVFIFGILGNYRTGFQEFLAVANFKGEHQSELFSGVYWVYMYLVMTLANLENLFNMPVSGFGHGAYMLNNFLPTVLVEHLFDNLSLRRYWLEHPNFTVSGYMVHSFLDFGPWGVFIYTFILGVICSIVYHNFIFRRTVKNTFIYSIIIMIISLSFFVDYLLYLPISFQLFWMIALNKFMVKREKDLVFINNG